MREICTSGLTRGSAGIGLYRRPAFSTLLFKKLPHDPNGTDLRG